MATGMRCPRCEEALEHARSPHGVVYRCGRCQGRAATMPVVRRALGARAAAELWAAAHAAAGTSALGCPQCGERMARTPSESGIPAPDVDVCRHCQLVWLDAAELPAGGHAQAPPPGPDAPSGARAAIALDVLRAERPPRHRLRRAAAAALLAAVVVWVLVRVLAR